MEQFSILKEFPLFNKLSEEELENVASRITEKAFDDGEVICRKGEAGESLYLIKQGEVAVTLPLYRYDKKHNVISILTEGMFLGELSFFDGKECSADVHAKGNVKLLELKRTDYDALINEDPEKGYDIQNKVILNLIRTIRKMNEKFSFNAFLH